MIIKSCSSVIFTVSAQQADMFWLNIIGKKVYFNANTHSIINRYKICRSLQFEY